MASELMENRGLIKLQNFTIAEDIAKEKALNEEISKLKAEISQLKGKP
jgi:hypothetical protein